MLQNEHIVSCLREFEDQAIEKKQEKLVFTIKKALRSVLKYPLPLKNGQECRVLEGIGPVLATKIDHWLKRKGLYKESDNAVDIEPSKEPATSSASLIPKANVNLQKKKRQKKYVPKFKSAPWAILVAMYRLYKTRKPGALDPTKEELVSLSSNLSDTPMLPTSSAKSFKYCGWSSMKSTLLAKKLVSIRSGRPQRFFLTDSGLKLARKLHMGALQMLESNIDVEWSDVTDVEESEDDSDSEELELVENASSSQHATSSSLYKVNTNVEILEIDSDSDIELLDSQPSELNTIQQPNDTISTSTQQTQNNFKLHMTYLNALYQPVASKDQAQVQLHTELGLVFLCELQIPLDVSFVDKDLEKNIIELNDKSSSAFIDRELMKNRKEIDAKRHNNANSKYFRIFIWMSDDACGDNSSQLIEQLFTSKKSLRIYTPENNIESNVTSQITTKEKQKKKPAKVSSKQRKRKAITIQDEDTTTSNVIDFRSFIQRVPNNTDNLVNSSKRSRTSKFSDNFDLILIVDQRERANNDRSYTVERLTEIGVSVESSQLGVGDFLWIARSKQTNFIIEYVLNCIVERKSVDDLAMSIIDGRFKEQRFRLRQIFQDQKNGHNQASNCASQLNVIYIIEGDLAKQNRLPLKNLQTALVRLQIFDKFQVKHTTSISQTIDFLKIMTHVLSRLLDEHGVDPYKLVLLDNSELFTPNLRQFNLYAAKSGAQQRNLSKKDIFARQLCCINGCSSHIAEAIVEQFADDPRTFIDKIQDDRGVTELSNVRIPCGKFKGVSLRRVGPALSKVLASYYNDE
jgi:ERCC4-type nuclease